MKKVFLDANIILDFLDSSRSAHKKVRKLFGLLIEQDYRPVISEDILTTIYYIVKDKAAVLGFFDHILSQWELVCLGIDTIEQAVKLCRENSTLDFEDVCQALAAKKAGCEVVITNDAEFFRPDGVTLYQAHEFLSG